ncbi:glucokinase [Parasphingopyxis sp.]|uniref:glucokinase n=1 Tax=Parasphingopyxis sp. TaxID=1920299 RepID=UPI0026018102|nr:glucokinase [Parasphingopyxis sp.]
MDIVTADIGGTHARFALATVRDGAVTDMGEPVTLRTGEHAGLADAWQAFAATLPDPAPRAAAIAIAAPIRGETIALTNSDWRFERDTIAQSLGLDHHILLNDFAAIAHAADALDARHFADICGPAGPLPESGAITVIGPGTGLGVAALLRTNEHSHVITSEGSHGDFAPLDAFEDRLLARLREVHGRVSVERVVSGPGLRTIYDVLAEDTGDSAWDRDDRELWAAALQGGDALASAALQHFCQCFGAAAGDLALTFGPGPVVIAGNLAARLADILPVSGFAERFTAKGRYREIMESVPVKRLTHPEPGLYGAAAAFAQSMR